MKHLKIRLLFALLLAAIFGFFLIQPVKADEVCKEKTKINFVVRDSSGKLIPKASVQVYDQVTDYNGQSKPNKSYASGRTNENLGQASLSWTNKEFSAIYAIKVSLSTSSDGDFWFYDNEFSCGEESTKVINLSGIALSLYDADGKQLTNTTISLYSQIVDSSGGLTSKKKVKVLSASTGSSGQVRFYVPQGSLRSLNRDLSDFYTIEFSRNSRTFSKKDIRVYDGQLNTLNYYISMMRVRLQDQYGSAFPSGTKVEVYEQDLGAGNMPIAGDKIGNFTIGDDYYGEYEVNPDTYVLAVKGSNGNYQYFWNADVTEGKRSTMILTSDQRWSSSTGCKNTSKLYLYLTTFTGKPIASLKYEVYEQDYDNRNLPKAGKKVASGSFDSNGQASPTFKPDPLKTYAVKIWDKKSDSGDFWFYDAAKFACDSDRYFEMQIPMLLITLRDSQNRVRANYSFSLYAQRFDANSKPVISDSDLIANLKTDSNGQTLVYVAAYNPYRSGQSGIYAITSKDKSNVVSTWYNIRMSTDRDYILNYNFSSLGGTVRDGRKKLMTAREVRLYEQLSDGKNWILGNLLLKTKTDNSGRFSFEYRQGVYALAVVDDLGQTNMFWNIGIIGGRNNIYDPVANMTRITLAGGLGQTVSSSESVRLYSLLYDQGKYYRDRLVGTLKLSNRSAYYSLAAGNYVAVYTAKNKLEYGKAFKAANKSYQTVAITVSNAAKMEEDTPLKF